MDFEFQDHLGNVEYYQNLSVHPFTKEISLYKNINRTDIQGVWEKKPYLKDGFLLFKRLFDYEKYRTFVRVIFDERKNPLNVDHYDKDRMTMVHYTMEYNKNNKITSVKVGGREFLFDGVKKAVFFYNEENEKIRRINYISQDGILISMDIYLFYNNEVKVINISPSLQVNYMRIYLVNSNDTFLLKEKKYDSISLNFYRDNFQIIRLFYDDMVDFDIYKSYDNYGQSTYSIRNLSPGKSKEEIYFYENGFLQTKVELLEENHENIKSNEKSRRQFYEESWKDYNIIIYESQSQNLSTTRLYKDGLIVSDRLTYANQINNEKIEAERRYEYYLNGNLFSLMTYINERPFDIQTFNILENIHIE